MIADTERHERTATTAVTGVSASQADLSAPLTEHRADPASTEAQGGENVSRAAPAANSDSAAEQSGTETPQASPATSRDAADAPAAVSASGAGAAAAETDRSASEDGDQGGAEIRLDGRVDARLEGASREVDKAAGSSTSIELHNEIVLTANGGADGAIPSPGTAWEEMGERLDGAPQDTGVAGLLDGATDRMNDRMDDFQDRAGSLLGSNDDAEEGLSGLLNDLRDQAEDFQDRAESLLGNEDGILSSLLDGIRTKANDLLSGDEADHGSEPLFENVEAQVDEMRSESVLDDAAGLLDTVRDQVDPGEGADGGLLEGLGSLRDDADNLLDGGSDGAPSDSGWLAALFDGDLAPPMSTEAFTTSLDDLGLDGADDGNDGDLNLPGGLAVTHPGEGFAFDPLDTHA